MLKKMVCFLVVVGMLFGVNAQFVNAQEINSGSANKTVITYEENGVQVIETTSAVSLEEAIALLMEKEGISYKDALDKLYSVALECNQDLGVLSPQGTMDSSMYHYETKTKCYKYGDNEQYVVEIGGLWYVYRNISFRQFEKNVSVWSAATASGAYEWEESTAVDTTGSYPTTVASAYARGVLVTTVSLGAGTGVTIGGTIYYRLPCELYLEWSLY